MSPEYHYGRQLIEDDDIAAVAEALCSDFLSQGPRLKRFEQAVAEYCGARHCVAVSSGTAGLHLAMLAAGLSEGDVGVTTALSFVATANAIRYTGAAPQFVDISPETFNMTAGLLDERLGQLKSHSNSPRVIVPVHFAGEPCDLAEIAEVAARHDCVVIEDACQALGAEYRGERIGNCRYSKAAVFSLHPVKTITSGEGGLILTNDDELAAEVRSTRGHGIARNAGAAPWHSEMVAEGFNYKITEIQCALGLSQLGKIDRFIDRRRELAKRYRERLSDLPIRFQKQDSRSKSAEHIFVALFDFEEMGIARVCFHEEMKAHGIHLYVHYYPIPFHAYYRRLGFREEDYPVAGQYYQSAFTLPLHPGLTIGDVDTICGHIRDVIRTSGKP